MADRLDRLFQEWHHLGGSVLLSKKQEDIRERRPEELIAESTAFCRESGRLTWVVLDWLERHIDLIDEDRLIEAARKIGDMSVLGVLCDAANLRSPHPGYERIMASCRPHDRLEPFFYRVARSRLASKLAYENALDVFRKWNYISNELRYLSQ
ncbi:MAG: hypothetical protein IT210_20355 [Armatimonadetes bacterium]|nr:hypothetical protein [Armatimonadota bacterium]